MIYYNNILKMKCPFCGNKETKVLDKRETEDLEATRRRRECLKCKKRFTTYERIETINLFVVKKDGRRESFNIGKIRNGILKACEKRPISMEQIEKSVNSIEAELNAKNKKEIPCDTVVIATGLVSRADLQEKLKEKGAEFHVIGSCRKPGQIAEAVEDAFEVGCRI